MRLIVFVTLTAVWGLSLSATIYKWVDENGVTHYSDQPHPGAQKLEVSSAQTYSAPPAPRVAPAARAPADAAGPVYQVCEIYKPSPDEVFFSVTSVTAKVRVEPTLRAGDQVVIALDGKRITQGTAENGEYTVSPIDRGEHKLMAVVEDAQGKRVCETPSVTFHVRQPSVLSPQSPTRPKRRT